MNRTTCLEGHPGATPGSGAGYGLNGLGIALGCVGSLSINLGNNLQARGHAEHAAGNKESPLWLVGTVVFFLASLIQFVAFAFAPASVVAPLESLQFIANLAFAKFVNKQTVTPRMALGTLLILIGTVVAVTFGPIDGTLLVPLDTLLANWDADGWIIYLSCILLTAALAECVHKYYAEAEAKGEPLWASSKLLPGSFALSSSLVGTQAVVQAKCMAELVKLITAGCIGEVLSSWLPYVTLVLLAACGALWLHRLNTALKTYDPMFIIPLLQSQYILCATISGGIYFKEFAKLTAKKVALFTFGILLMLLGLYCMLPPDGGAEPDDDSLRDPNRPSSDLELTGHSQKAKSQPGSLRASKNGATDEVTPIPGPLDERDSHLTVAITD
jgi:drug/metabolite transporter (DMT)-like permease